MTSVVTSVPWAGPVDLPLAGERDVQAACGLMHVHGRRFGRPTALGLDYASIVAAELDAIGAGALDVARLRGVPLRRVSTSVAQAALLAVSQYLAAATADEPDAVGGGVGGGLGGPPFRSADGVAFEVEALDAEVWRRFWSALDAAPGAVAAAWRPFALRFATATCALPPELTGLTGRLSITRLEQVAAVTGMTLVRVAHRAVDDLPPYRIRSLGAGAAAGGAFRAGELRVRGTGGLHGGEGLPSVGKLRVAGESRGVGDLRGGGGLCVAGESGGVGDLRGAAEPCGGGGLRGGGGLTSAAERCACAELPLSGLVVVESCRRVQGPMAGHLLWQLGASVVRVEPPGGDPLRGVPPVSGDVSARFHALNRGKQVVEVDLATATGRRALLELASGADVFLHNWAPGKAAAWALTAQDLAWARPGIVYAQASGWGDALGPRPPLGTDFVVQAHAGVPPSLMTIVDVFGGVVCARGVVEAVARRIRSGAGQAVASSLLSAASRLNALATRRCTAPLSVPVCTDLAALGRDPRFSRALVRDGCVVPVSAWEFE
ncbi:CoA transferase [Saccharothrix sp. NRRL B-16314]|uniref:CoA transferase n=1 Tax=Saccharothrix sp. NRRL B-16314 TaxID=1463825 RepID=UPI0005247C01|nr:CoA transferase [Saccharothrix sp. NRRL B-16314]